MSKKIVYIIPMCFKGLYVLYRCAKSFICICINIRLWETKR